MRQTSVVSDVRRVAPLGSVICWQEIAPQRYKDAVRENLSTGWRHTHLDHETPISFETAVWSLRGKGSTRTHPGRVHVTPSRYLVWTVLERVGHGYTIAVVNTHYVSGAWSNRHLLTRNWRRTQWMIHWQKQRDLTRNLVSQGHTVLGAGDFNRVALPKFMPTQREFGAGGSIDHVFAIEANGGTKVRLVKMRSIQGLHTDHRPRVAELTLSR